MAELVPAPFGDLVTRLHREPVLQDALFELPRRRWYLPGPDTPDLSVEFHGARAGNASGPAAGPHTQMAQNILLSYVAGGRILELKTVQVNDRLQIGRPCIDMTNIGFNIEWSQELRIADSIREYVAGSMLVAMFRREVSRAGFTRPADLASGANRRAVGQESCPPWANGPAGEVIYDLSVGYDLAGIKSASVCQFLDAMRDASTWVDRLRMEIPGEFRSAREAEYRPRISDSITLSTFHGCPAGEIESICEFLIGDRGFDVIVKMNPPTLGRQRVEHLLHDVMGYTHLEVNPKAYGAAITFDESIGLCERLTAFARQHSRRLGFKFSNTLEVVNRGKFFPPGNEISYLSGQPLHVITLALTEEFRRAVGSDVPISFSAGIDRANFPAAVACGFVPVTVSSDLLRPGGYGRLGTYLEHLAAEMKRVGAGNIDEFVLRYFDQCEAARKHAERVSPGTGGMAHAGVAMQQRQACLWAGLLNTTIAAKAAAADSRYYASANGKVPKRIDSHLEIFDCITCDKCLPVCPNAANFIYPTPVVAFDYCDIIVAPDGTWRDGEKRRFAIDRSTQIACYADFCNECGNCDTFCPEYGGPYIEKPSFFGSAESWERAAPRDGFIVGRDGCMAWIRGRIKGCVYELNMEPGAARCRFADGVVLATINSASHGMIGLRVTGPLTAEHRLDMWAYHTMRHLYAGITDPSRINQVNAEFAATT